MLYSWGFAVYRSPFSTNGPCSNIGIQLAKAAACGHALLSCWETLGGFCVSSWPQQTFLQYVSERGFLCICEIECTNRVTAGWFYFICVFKALLFLCMLLRWAFFFLMQTIGDVHIVRLCRFSICAVIMVAHRSATAFLLFLVPFCKFALKLTNESSLMNENGSDAVFLFFFGGAAFI